MINRKTKEYDFMNLLSIENKDTVFNILKTEKDGKPLIHKYLENIDYQKLFDCLYQELKYTPVNRIDLYAFKNIATYLYDKGADTIIRILLDYPFDNEIEPLFKLFALTSKNTLSSAYFRGAIKDNDYDINLALKYVEEVFEEEQKYFVEHDICSIEEIVAEQFLVAYSLFDSEHLETKSKSINDIFHFSVPKCFYQLLDFAKTVTDEPLDIIDYIFNIDQNSLFTEEYLGYSDPVYATLINDAFFGNDSNKEKAILLLKSKNFLSFLKKKDGFSKGEPKETIEGILYLKTNQINDLLDIMDVDLKSRMYIEKDSIMNKSILDFKTKDDIKEYAKKRAFEEYPINTRMQNKIAQCVVYRRIVEYLGEKLNFIEEDE